MPCDAVDCRFYEVVYDGQVLLNNPHAREMYYLRLSTTRIPPTSHVARSGPCTVTPRSSRDARLHAGCAASDAESTRVNLEVASFGVK